VVWVGGVVRLRRSLAPLADVGENRDHHVGMMP
jgi:hypothetical protein